MAIPRMQGHEHDDNNNDNDFFRKRRIPMGGRSISSKKGDATMEARGRQRESGLYRKREKGGGQGGGGPN